MRPKTWEQEQAKAAVQRALKKWGKAYEHLGADLKWAIVAVEIVNLVYLQQTQSEEVKKLQEVITEARELTEAI